MLFDFKENEKFDLIRNGVTLEHSNHEKILCVIINNKLFFDEHMINIYKTANKNSTLLVE